MKTKRFAAAALLRAVRLALALSVALPLTCQNETEPYFSLSSSRTFASSEKPSIQLSGVHVPAVQIRVYRVKDPLEFVRQLEDPHSFGGRYNRPSNKPSLLEIVHEWKRSLRRNIRLNLRAQFSESPRAHWEKLLPQKAPPAAAQANYYAEAPLLNQQQLVMSFVQPLSGGINWNATTVPVAVKQKGLFLVEAVHGSLRAYTILLVSDTVLVTKTGREQIVTWLAERSSGEPVVDARLAATTRQGTPATFKTDAQGMVKIPKPGQTTSDLRLLAVRGDDIALGNLAEWNFLSSRRNWSGYIYTDRPVYRPGDTMHFRGILRLQAAVGYETPASQSFSVQISDPDGKPVYQKALTSNSNGVIHDELTLGHGAALGNYYVQVRSGESQMSGNFEVQEYKKPEYEVRVTTSTPRVLEGQPIDAVIDARYYFGEPVNGAKVKYSVYRTRYWFPLWYDADSEGSEGDPADQGDQYADADAEQISEQEGRLDSDGKLTIHVPTTVSDNKIDYRYRIEAGVTDAAGREISGTGWFTATYGSFLLNAQAQRYFFEPSSKAAFKVEARDYDNKPIATGVHLELALMNLRERKPGAVVSQIDSRTAETGSADVELSIPARGGEYRVLATARTPEGRTVQYIQYIWVAGSGETNFWDTGTQHSVQLVPDKKSYRPGDTAKILLVTGRPHTPVLVSVEGRDIRSLQLIRSEGATAEFDYKVTADDEPGFFVSAQFVREGEMYQGQKQMKVPPEDHKLAVKMVTDKAQYLPGQTANYSLDVTTPEGKPLAGADLSLGVVDEAIYAIRRDATPDIVEFFYGHEYNGVYTENSLNYFFNGEAGTRRMRLAELRRPSQLAQLKPDRLVKPKVRKAFPDTAFWAADITTDQAGHALARVAFPDSLTTWRATARGVAPGERFGSATQKTIVRKNLILRLAVPRFFVQGDEVVISAVVHNYLQTAKKAQVNVKLAGLSIVGSNPTQEIEIASKSEGKVDWRVKADTIGQATITAQALTDEESDALELPLPVHPPGVPMRQSQGSSITNSGTADLTLTFPPEAVAGSRSLSIRLSPSIAGSIFSALDYLTSYPYGCVEQTMSSFLPDLMVSKAMRELQLKTPIDQETLNQKIQAGLDRLYSFEHGDGGWGWWQTDDSHPFMTAYVVAGLAEARADGVAVKEEALTNGSAWISKYLAAQKGLAPDLRAYLVYAMVLAGHTDQAALNQSYQERTSLSTYGLAILGLAFESVKDARAGDVAGQLEGSVRQSDEEASWQATRDEMLDFSADITPETTAYAMKLLSHQRPKSALLPKAALWLVNHRNEGYWWSSTKQTAMVIYGLIDYLKATNELHPDLKSTVSINGRSIASQSFDSSNPLASPETVLDDVKLAPGLNRVQITSSGQGRLYYSVSAVHYSNQARFEKQATVSLNILRDYFRLAPDQSSGRILYNLNALDGAVSQGDVLAVRLTVTGSEWKYLMIEDPIPAGAEFIEKDNLYELREKPPWWQYWFTRRELHDDRMAIFQTYFSEGQKQYFYLLKVVNPGLFHVNPARVEPMYQPGHEATTEARTVESK